jgi:hypothetical protein
VCGGPNECAAASSGSFDAPVRGIQVSAELARVPAEEPIVLACVAGA